MDSKIFYVGIKELCEWFNKKLTGNQSDMWFQELKYIPDEAFQDAVQKAKDNEGYMPKPIFFKKAFAQFRRDNPTMFTLDENQIQTDCLECNGNGYIWAWHNAGKKEKPDWNRIELACGACQNWRRTLPPNRSRFWTLAEIENAGMLLEDPYLRKIPKTKSYENIEKMVDEVCQIPLDQIPF